MGKSPAPHLHRANQFHSSNPSPYRQLPNRNPSTPAHRPKKPSLLCHVSHKTAIFFTAFSSKSEKVDTSNNGSEAVQDHGFGGKSPVAIERRSYGLTTSMNFSLQDVHDATDNFSLDNLIGQGGFGTVYRGQLKDGSLVAAKRAKSNPFGKRMGAEFHNEILALSKIEHLNLVRLLGYVMQNGEKVIVVEYIGNGNGNLVEHLDGTRGNGLDLAQRLDIAIDVAHAVAYLHNYTDPPMIHRDIKAANVLITEKLRAKVADFGFARMVPADDAATHISTQAKGRAGYLDHEHLQTYQLTEKSDVYSFGVLIVELVTGRRPLEPKRGLKERVTAKWEGVIM